MRWERERIRGRAPLFGNAGFDRCHRDLGEAAEDERGKDHAEGLLLVEGPASEHDAVAAAHLLRPRREARVGRLEAETIPLLDGRDFLAEAASQAEKSPRAAAGGDASADASRSVRGQRRRHEEALRFEAEGRVHRCSNPVRWSVSPFLAYPISRRAHRRYGRKGA